jgi:hypothetical protein
MIILLRLPPIWQGIQWKVKLRNFHPEFCPHARFMACNYINLKVSAKINVSSRNIAFSRKHYHATYMSRKSTSMEKSIFHERSICFHCNF